MATYESLYHYEQISVKRLPKDCFSGLWLVSDQQAAISALYNITVTYDTSFVHNPFLPRLAAGITAVGSAAISKCHRGSLQMDDSDCPNYQRLLPILLDLLTNEPVWQDFFLTRFGCYAPAPDRRFLAVHDHDDAGIKGGEHLKRKREDSTVMLDHLSEFSATTSESQTSSIPASESISAQIPAKRIRGIESAPAALGTPQVAAGPSSDEGEATAVHHSSVPLSSTSPLPVPSALSSISSDRLTLVSSAVLPLIDTQKQLFRNRHFISPLERDQLLEQGITVEYSCGRGGQAAVFVATSLSSPAPFALKKIVPTRYQAPELEVLEIIRCSPHPHLISAEKVYSTGAGVRWARFELASGDLLKLVKEKKGLSLGATASIVYDLVTALLHLHGLNIFHRDIKLANILVCEDGTVKLADFGLAVIIEDGSDIAHSEVGTYPKPPEVTLYDSYSPSKADIYSLGCTAFQMHFNRSKPDSDADLLEDLSALSSSSNFIACAFGQFLQTCLQEDADKRPTVQELYHESMFLRFGCQRAELLEELGLDSKSIVAPEVSVMPGAWEGRRSSSVS